MTRRALCTAVAAVSFAVAAAAATAQTAPLPAADVACNAEQLTRLAARTAVARSAGAADKSIGVAYTFSSRLGDFTGIAYTHQFTPEGNLAATPEHHLWFSTNPHEVKMLRNPARAALPTLSLTRNALNSDLVGSGDPDRFDLIIDPTAAGGAVAAELLHLNNLDGALGHATSSKPGRGLNGVVASCHDRFTAADLHVFALLAKTLRAFPFTADGDSRDSVMTIYRDEASVATATGRRATYRIDVVPLDGGGLSERSAFVFEIEVSAEGRLGDGRLAILPACSGGATSDCTAPGASAMLIFSRPVLSGGYWTMSPATPSACSEDLSKVPGCSPSVEIRLSEMLAGSTWLQVR